MLPARNQESVMPGRLRPFAPFGQLPADQLILAAGRTSLKRFRDGDVLLPRGSRDADDFFLLEGRVTLLDLDGNSRLIASGTPEAVNPLSPLRPSLFEVRALGPVACAKVARDDLEVLRGMARRLSGAPPSAAPDPDATMGLFDSLEADIAAERLKLPSLPDHALRVRAAIADANCDARRIADLLAADPAVAAKILKIANSPLCRGATAVNSLREAVNRIGLFTVGELVVCFSLKDLFKTSAPGLRERFGELVIEAVRVGAAASVVAARVRGIGAEQALVAGLLSNIGDYVVLERLASQPALLADASRLERALAQHGPGIGALVCRHWQLGDDVVEAVARARDWRHQADGAPSLAEVVLCARYHALLSLQKTAQLVKSADIPALRVLGETLTPQVSMEIIRESRARVEALQQALG